MDIADAVGSTIAVFVLLLHFPLADASAYCHSTVLPQQRSRSESEENVRHKVEEESMAKA